MSGHLFWTLFQALAPMIWFYPLNELEISGFEAFALCLFSPALADLQFTGSILTNRWVVAFFRLECSYISNKHCHQLSVVGQHVCYSCLRTSVFICFLLFSESIFQKLIVSFLSAYCLFCIQRCSLH